MNLRAVAFAAVVGLTVSFAGCQHPTDMESLDKLSAGTPELTRAVQDKLLVIAGRNNVEPVNAGTTFTPVLRKFIDVVSTFADAQVKKIPYELRPLVKEDLARLKQLHGRSIYSILSDVADLPATAQERCRQWAVGALATETADRGAYEIRQTSDNTIDLIVTKSFQAGGTTSNQLPRVATMTFSEAKALTEYARKRNSEPNSVQ